MVYNARRARERDVERNVTGFRHREGSSSSERESGGYLPYAPI